MQCSESFPARLQEDVLNFEFYFNATIHGHQTVVAFAGVHFLHCFPQFERFLLLLCCFQYEAAAVQCSWVVILEISQNILTGKCASPQSVLYIKCIMCPTNRTKGPCSFKLHFTPT